MSKNNITCLISMIYKRNSTILQILFAILISGFFVYWIHRFSHEFDGVLWKIHSIHHSSERLYWLNAFRFHPFNTLWNGFFSLFPLLLLGFNEDVIFITGVINNYIGFLNHTNIDFRLGYLNYIFNMGEIHRWHHSKNIKQANKNYSGGSLVIWDHVFGTYYYPKKKIEKNYVGLFEKSKSPKYSYFKQILFPLRTK